MIKNKKGFTLIELIIVMAIIGILAVVAIVAIAGKSADARDARRQADMSAVQTGLALFCYSAANDGDPTTVTGCLNGAGAGVEVPLSTCDDLANTITLSGINDPSEPGILLANACDDTPTTYCNYGVTVGAGTTFDACSYHIYSWLETPGASGAVLHVTQAGMITTEL